mmetsp:Transcript_65630/g.152486  ORF Transcript_65630/g.152486 Transcript_65630/m.152486 type:complete len:526 (+) Transcript_65630:70-1647(+)
MVLGADDGWPAENVFEGAKSGYAYDDIILMPGHISFDMSAMETSGRLTRKIKLNLPLASSPVDSVTESELAVGLALVGGIGFIHCNQSIDSQVEMVKRAKRFVSGFILEPICLRPDHTLKDVDKIKKRTGISGVCITENGRLGSKLAGFISSRDHENTEDRDTKISNIMVTRVIKSQEPITIEEAQAQLKKSKVGKLPIVNAEGRLITMVTRADIKKVRDFPRMSRDFHGQLLAGAKVIVHGWNDDGEQPRAGALERARCLAEAGADVICLDPTQASNDAQLKIIKRLKEDYPKVEIVAGPVVSCREAKRLVEAGADGLLVGGGVSCAGGVGRAEATALFELAKYVRENYGTDIPVIAGGAIRNVGHLLKAFCLGASALMLAEPFSGTDEAPGRHLLVDDALQKLHSKDEEALRAMRHSVAPGGLVGSRARHDTQVFPRSLVSAGHCKGSVRLLAPYLMQGVRNGMYDLGQRSIPELHEALHSGELRLECLLPHAKEASEARKEMLKKTPHPEVMPVFTAAELNC